MLIVHHTDHRYMPLDNGPSPDALIEEYQAEQREVARRLSEQPIAEWPSIAAWRRTFTACGVKPTQHRVAAEALLRRLHKAGNIPSINMLVDIGNFVSIRHGLPVAMFDRAQTTGSTTVRFATGTEHFTDLGATALVHPERGEVVFVDDAELVSARRWCWRQSAQSATQPSTTQVLITVEAQHDGASGDVEAAMADLARLLERYQPHSSSQSARLGAGRWSVALED